jgi:hypothetical protein
MRGFRRLPLPKSLKIGEHTYHFLTSEIGYTELLKAKMVAITEVD